MTPFPKDDNKDHNPEIEQMIQDRIDGHRQHPPTEYVAGERPIISKPDKKMILKLELVNLGAHSFWFHGCLGPKEDDYSKFLYSISVLIPGRPNFTHTIVSNGDGSFPHDIEECLLEKALEYAKQKQ